VSDAKPQTTEQKLFAAMDEAALSFVKILTTDVRDEDGKPLVTFKDKVATFKLALEWLVKSQRIKPAEEDELPAGVKKMKAMIDTMDPAAPVIQAKGRPPGSKNKTPPKPRRRPKTEAQKARIGEGAALKKALAGDGVPRKSMVIAT